MAMKIPEYQRALVFQGGGALGAYEVGVYEAVYEKFIKEKKDKHPFDIIVGTSIGAINGALLVSFYKKNNTWEGSAEHLKAFWKHLSDTPVFSDVFSQMWSNWRKFWPGAPSEEEARRHFAVKEFLHKGVSNVFTVPQLRFDVPFLGLDDPWYQSSNAGLKQSLEKFIDFPIATEYEKDEPRLLLVAVDVQESAPVVFDSYKKADGKRKTLYGQRSAKGAIQDGFLIEYDGIEVDHILASSNVPINYDFVKIQAKELTGTDTSKGKEVTRYLWDGGILHNTPIVPLIVYHKIFWDHYIGIEKQRDAIFTGDDKQTLAPELRTYVVDMWAKKTKDVPVSRNETKSRYYEIMYSDKTEYEERMMSVFDDFVTLSKDLIHLAKEKGATKSDLEKILMRPVETQFYAGIQRNYIDHIRGKFPMKIVRIQRSDDPNDIADQAFDFSRKTIDLLFQEGYRDAKKFIKKI